MHTMFYDIGARLFNGTNLAMHSLEVSVGMKPVTIFLSNFSNNN